MSTDKDGYFNRDRIHENSFNDGIYSNAIRAGKRTYFIDVKTTRSDEYYLTITESKKKIDAQGNVSFEKHKIYLYKEDFEKLKEGLSEAVAFINENQPLITELDEPEEITTVFSNVDFDDL